MKNICDYAINYQNEKIENINELDALIFARLSYIHFEEIIDKVPLKIGEIPNYEKLLKINFRDKKLINILKTSLRYKDLEIINCENILDSDKEEQFFAMTIRLLNKDIVVSFRGTNKNLIGFKEDLNMSYGTIPSQISALEYINKITKYRKMYLVGHSKGGNLAMYAGANLPFIKQRKLVSIYNFDGPGFLTSDSKCKKIQDKIINFYPETCIVGRMLENTAKCNVIRTNTFGIEAHNVYSWMIDDNMLVRGNFSTNSDEFASACETFILNVEPASRKIIVDFLYEMTIKGEIKNLKELNLDAAKEIIAKIPRISKQEKNSLITLMKSFMKALLPVKKH